MLLTLLIKDSIKKEKVFMVIYLKKNTIIDV
jgi:hypothetical protein